MQILTQISQIPIWLLTILLVILLCIIVYALVTGREIRFWPPSIGPSIETSHLENQVKQLKEQVSEEKSRNEGYQKEIERITKTYKDEIDLLRTNINETKADYSDLNEKFKATWEPLSREPGMRTILTLFDRRAMKVPANEEHLILMIKSLHNLRVSLQKSGVSTIRNPLARELFEKIKRDIKWVEDITMTLSKRELVKPEFFWPPGGNIIAGLAEEFKNSPAFTDIPVSVENEFDDTHDFLDTMIRRSLELDADEKIAREQVVDLSTVVWIFASVDRTRMNVLSEIAVLQKLIEQDG